MAKANQLKQERGGWRRGMARDAACGANNKAVCDRNASKDQKAVISNQNGCRM